MSQNLTAILPGAAIGVLGSGQLGRMFAIAARRMGYRVHTLSPDTDTPTGQVADLEINAAYEDLDAVRNFAKGVSVVTFEFENVPAATAQAAAEFAPVRPDGSVLHTAQNRLREKTFLAKNGFPVPRFCKVESESELRAALQQTGFPAILKTAGFGYDGKGQSRIDSANQIASIASSLSGTQYILEEFVDFDHEVSVIGARGMSGSFVHWGVIENSHRNHILDTSMAPANVSNEIAKKAIEIARNILEQLNVIGVLCVEFFVSKKGELLINELAPRPHNSGHLTFDACVTSQFEQQLRTVCGLPMGSTQLLRPAAMANLLGDLWSHGEPDWVRACASPEIKLHLYGKPIPKPGRKMGHLTALADSPQKAVDLVRTARQSLQA